jgi:hypothetical protein
MKELTVRQVTSASARELRRAVTELGPVPVPALTLRWRARANVRALDSGFAVEIAPVDGGRTALTCRYHFAGPFSFLTTKEEYERLRGNLQYIAAVICHRAEKLSGSRCDGRPPPLNKASGSADHSARGCAATRRAAFERLATTANLSSRRSRSAGAT